MSITIIYHAVAKKVTDGSGMEIPQLSLDTDCDWH